MSKALDTSFKYKITNYDLKTQTIRVEYSDGSWASIELMVPLPEDRAGLEAIIAQFTSPVEHRMAISQDEPVSFIKEMLGKELEGERLYRFPPEPEVDDGELTDALIDEVLGKDKKP